MGAPFSSRNDRKHQRDKRRPCGRITCFKSALRFPTNGLPKVRKTLAGTYSAFAVPVSTIVTVAGDADVQPYSHVHISQTFLNNTASFSLSKALYWSPHRPTGTSHAYNFKPNEMLRFRDRSCPQCCFEQIAVRPDSKMTGYCLLVADLQLQFAGHNIAMIEVQTQACQSGISDDS